MALPVGSLSADRLAFEALISDTSARLMSASSLDLRAVVESALDRIRLFFNADRCALLGVAADQRVATVNYDAYAQGVTPVSGDLNLWDLFPWAAVILLERREPCVVGRMADLPPEAAMDRAAWEQMGAKSNLAVPILVGNVVTHLIALHAVAEECAWPVEFIPRLRVLGEMMASAIQRTEAFETLRTSEHALREQALRLEAAIDAAEVGFADSDPDGVGVFMDARLAQLLGLETGEPQQMPDVWLSRIDAEHRELVLTHARRLQRREAERATVEYRYQHPTGGWIWLRHATRRAENTSRGPRLFSALQDITERRVREEALRASHDEEKRLRDQLEHENVYLRRQVAQPSDTQLVTGRSRAIREALEMAEQVGPTTSTVLIVGETGTGKERFAEFIHQSSPRRRHHMVRVNCSAIPSALIESELFGREKGAYTGALSKQVGRFELAHGSTLFLDEIGDLPMDVQVKLLRVLQERTIERLGSPTPVRVDVRIIAATNRDLEAAVRAGTFRADLYYRLNVFPIVIPPLRERREDIPTLVDILMEELGGVIRKRFDSVERASLEALASYDWPGNVRELRNVLERGMILAAGPTLKVAPPQTNLLDSEPTPAHVPASQDLQAVERDHIVRVLEQTGWRIRGSQAAAEVLGLKPTTLEARMTRLGIRRPAARRLD